MSEPNFPPCIVGPVDINAGGNDGLHGVGYKGGGEAIPCSLPTDQGHVHLCGSASSPSPGSPQLQVHWLHLAMASLLLALLGAFTYLRRPALLCLSGVAALVGTFGPAAPAYGTAGVLAVVLPATAEWLLNRSEGSRLLWPPALALLAGTFGVCFALFHVWGEMAVPLLLGAGMVLTLPWVPVMSAAQLALSGQLTGRDFMARIAVTRMLLSTFQARLKVRSVDGLDIIWTADSTTAALLVRLDELDTQVPRMTASEHSELRQTLLSAQALLEAGLAEDALNTLVTGLPAREGEDVLRPLGPGNVFDALPAERRGWLIRNGVALIHAYRLIVPEHRRRGCRFEPTCSAYIEEALAQHGLLGGLRLGFKRALRCVPYGDAGLDPVPNARGNSASSRAAFTQNNRETFFCRRQQPEKEIEP